jgi:hypothetical protein
MIAVDVSIRAEDDLEVYQEVDPVRGNYFLI